LPFKNDIRNKNLVNTYFNYYRY